MISTDDEPQNLKLTTSYECYDEDDDKKRYILSFTLYIEYNDLGGKGNIQLRTKIDDINK